MKKTTTIIATIAIIATIIGTAIGCYVHEVQQEKKFQELKELDTIRILEDYPEMATRYVQAIHICNSDAFENADVATVLEQDGEPTICIMDRHSFIRDISMVLWTRGQ